MNCPRCNRPVSEGVSFCSECGASIGNDKSFATLKRKSISTVIKEKIKSPLFLVYTVFMSLAALFFVINIAAGGAISALISVAGGVCTAIPAVKCWMMYFSDENISASSIKSINVHNIAMITITSLGCIFSGLVSFLVVIACVLGGFLLSTIGEAENVISRAIDMIGLSSRVSTDKLLEVFKNGGVIIAIAGFAFAALVLFVTINSVLLYKNNSFHVEKIVSSFENDKYEAKRYPLIRPWIFGIAFAALGVLSFASSFIVALILISLAGTLITSSLWFAAIHIDRNSAESVEEVVTDAPVVKVKAPKVKKTKVKAPKVKKSKVEEPVVEEPKVEAPVVEEPKVETPVVEENKVNESVTEVAEETAEPEKTEEASEVVEPKAVEAEPEAVETEAVETEPEAVETEAVEAEPEAVETEAVEAEPEAVEAEAEESKEQN